MPAFDRHTQGTSGRGAGTLLALCGMTMGLAAMIGCSEESNLPDETFPFATTHHGTVTGQVLGNSGTPLPDVHVIVRFEEFAKATSNPSRTTNSSGEFALTIEHGGSSSGQVLPDSLRGWLRAAALQPEYSSRVVDSVQVTVRFGPIEEPAPVVETTIELPISGSSLAR